MRVWRLVCALVVGVLTGHLVFANTPPPKQAPECTPTAKVLDRGLEIGARGFLRSKAKLDKTEEQ
jgi:hypothetical protein